MRNLQIYEILLKIHICVLLQKKYLYLQKAQVCWRISNLKYFLR